MALGDGFAEAIRQATSSEGTDALTAMFGSFFTRMADDLYTRLREDVIAEVRAEVQRANVTPVVHVAAPNVTVAPPQVLAGDIEVSVPKAPAPTVKIEPRKHIRIIRDESSGQITGAEVT